MGINTFRGLAHTLGEATVPLERGQFLLVSPFHPEAKFSEAQALARNKLIVGLAGAVFVAAAGEKDVARATAEEALRLGKTAYVWDVAPSSEPAATGNQALIQAGALPIGGLPDILNAVEAIVATALELLEAREAPAAVPPPAAQVKEAELPYDSQAVLDLLSEAGRVPESLVRRLREAAGE
jgi:predicted Rossmann fold nucleotide-binding protein DprA/Smf involved in DNA uptake